MGNKGGGATDANWRTMGIMIANRSLISDDGGEDDGEDADRGREAS